MVICIVLKLLSNALAEEVQVQSVAQMFAWSVNICSGSELCGTMVLLVIFDTHNTAHPSVRLGLLSVMLNSYY